MTTARQVFHATRKAGIKLTTDGIRLSFEAPAGAIDPFRPVIARIKPELIAVLVGDYLHAAVRLALRETAGEHRQEMAEVFDERLAICLCEQVDYGEACRLAYIAMARAIEQHASCASAEERAA